MVWQTTIANTLRNSHMNETTFGTGDECCRKKHAKWIPVLLFAYIHIDVKYTCALNDCWLTMIGNLVIKDGINLCDTYPWCITTNRRGKITCVLLATCINENRYIWKFTLRRRRRQWRWGRRHFEWGGGAIKMSTPPLQTSTSTFGMGASTLWVGLTGNVDEVIKMQLDALAISAIDSGGRVLTIRIFCPLSTHLKYESYFVEMGCS